MNLPDDDFVQISAAVKLFRSNRGLRVADNFADTSPKIWRIRANHRLHYGRTIEAALYRRTLPMLSLTESPIEDLFLFQMARPSLAYGGDAIWRSSRMDLTLSAQVRLRGFRMDFVLHDAERRLAIECDGAAFHTDLAADALRQADILDAGFSILRIDGATIWNSDITYEVFSAFHQLGPHEAKVISLQPIACAEPSILADIFGPGGRYK